MRARWLRSTNVVLCFLLAFYMAAGSFAPPAMAQTDEFVPTQEESYPIAPGVNHRSMTLTDGEHVERVNLMEIDPAANFATGKENMSLFNAPYVVSIGNHEISGTNSRVNYQKAFGDPTYFYDYGNTRIIGLDSASGKLTNSDASQWRWLSEVLNSTEKDNIIVIMHVPPDEISASGVDFNTGHGFKDAQEAQRFYDLLGAYKTAHPDKKLIVFSGDLHAYHHKTVQGVD